VGYEWEDINGSFLVTDFVDTDLRIWHPTAETGFNERLLVLKTVTFSRTTTHFYGALDFGAMKAKEEPKTI
jgi:hypothetical protein